MPVSRSSRSTNSRQNLYARSKEKGITMPSSCGRCNEKGLECRVLAGSAHCGECGKSGVEKFCDIFGVTAAAWARVDSEEQRLRKENERFRLEEEEAMSKILRLRTQARQTQSKLDTLREKAGKMLQYDLKTIDELEEFERKEKLEEEERNRASITAAAPTTDTSEFDSSWFPSPDDPFWADPGIVDETRLVSPGNPSSS
jgi:hypothetical protein